MAFLQFAYEQKLDDDEIYAVLDIIENYWARRIICGLPANVLNKVFCTLHSDILKVIEEHSIRQIKISAPYSEILKYVLLKKQGTAIFPRDKYLTEYFKARQIYKIPIEYRYFLFERLENENGQEIHDVIKGMKEGSITIEHIMSQTLSLQWKQELGSDFERVHDEYPYTFANLTLTGYNANYSNHSFKQKKEGYKDRKGKTVYGFDDSAFRLNNFIKKCTKWTENELIERQGILFQKFLGLWSMPETKYIPLEKETESVSFNENEYELTGRKITAFIYKGIKHPVVTWKDMLIEVCKLVFEEHNLTVLKLCDKKYWFHHTASEERTCFADDCYVYSSCSTKAKMTILNTLFDGCHIPYSDLEFELIPISNNNKEEETDDE